MTDLLWYVTIVVNKNKRQKAGTHMLLMNLQLPMQEANMMHEKEILQDTI